MVVEVIVDEAGDGEIAVVVSGLQTQLQGLACGGGGLGEGLGVQLGLQEGIGRALVHQQGQGASPPGPWAVWPAARSRQASQAAQASGSGPSRWPRAF